MNVFVTGATGTIGNAVARAFRDAGHRVAGLARSDAKARALAAAEIEPVAGDLAEPESLRAALAAAEVLVHCAAEPSRSMVERDAAAIELLLDSARRAPAPRAVLYTSGVWVYGDTGDAPADESTPLRPFPFVAWRVEHEQRILAAASPSVRAVVLRPGCVYGLGGSLTGFWFAAGAAGEVEIAGDGTNRWSMIHADDLGAAYVLAARAAPPGQVLNVTDGTSFTVGEMAAAAAVAAGVPGRVRSLSADEVRERFGAIAPGIAADQRISSERARRLLGWAPRRAPFVAEADLYFGAWRASR